MQNYQDLILVYLLPATNQEKDHSFDEQSLQSVAHDTRIFNDADDCIDQMSSLSNPNIFLILGNGRTNLLPVVSDLSCLRFVYLREPHPSVITLDKLRGVFPHFSQLLAQLQKDVELIIDYDTHLRLSYDGELSRSHRSIKPMLNNQAELKRMSILLEVILELQRPVTPSHQDMLNECRLMYPTETEKINAFEKNYQPFDAIRWYTQNSFWYKAVNMALRTSNTAIIWKFRFFVQDLYRQLEQMYIEQRSAEKRCFTVYRGQRIRHDELESIRQSVGERIVMTSFLSASRDPQVALQFSGQGEGRPYYESVIFEISIDENELDDECLPFADISRHSAVKDESEVLMCMGTVMLIESIKSLDCIIWIHLRMWKQGCSFNTYLKRRSFDGSEWNVDDESEVLFILSEFLSREDSWDEAEQVLHQIKLTGNQTFDALIQNYLKLARMHQTCYGIGPDSDELTDLFQEQARLYLALAQSSRFSNCVREKQIQYFSFLIGMYKESDGLNSLKRHAEFCQRISLYSIYRPWVKQRHEALMSLQRIMTESDSVPISTIYDQVQSILNEHFSQDEGARVEMSQLPALIAAKRGEYDQANRIYQEVLSSTSHNRYRATILGQLINVSQARESWAEVIHYCQELINIRQLSPNSVVVFEAHLQCGEAYLELGDEDQAFTCFTVAGDLLDQHHRSNPFLVGKFYNRIGDVYHRQIVIPAALNSYYQAVFSDDPQSASSAHRKIGDIHRAREDYDLAREHLLESVKIQKSQSRPNEMEFAFAYESLFEVEHLTGNNEQRDIYMHEALKLSVNNSKLHSLITQWIQKTLKREVVSTK